MGKQHGAGGWGSAWLEGGQRRPSPGPSPELGVVDQGAERGGEGSRFALQPRRAGSGHGLPRGGRRRREGGGGQARGKAGLLRRRGGGRRAVREGPSLGKPGRQRRGRAAGAAAGGREGAAGGGGHPGCRGGSVRERSAQAGVPAAHGTAPAPPQPVALLQRSPRMGQMGVKAGGQLGFGKGQPTHNGHPRLDVHSPAVESGWAWLGPWQRGRLEPRAAPGLAKAASPADAPGQSPAAPVCA